MAAVFPKTDRRILRLADFEYAPRHDIYIRRRLYLYPSMFPEENIAPEPAWMKPVIAIAILATAIWWLVIAKSMTKTAESIMIYVETFI